MDQLNQDNLTMKTTVQLQNEMKYNMKTEDKSSPYLIKIRQNFNVFGLISLLFGGFFTMLFYKAGIGINLLLFVGVMVALMGIVMKYLSLTIKKSSVMCYVGAIILGLSSMLTGSETLHLFNIIGIMLLLDLSLLYQFHDTSNWEFTKNIKFVLSLPFECIAEIGKPFVDCVEFAKNIKILKNKTIRNILIGIGISLPLLLFIGGLLSSADLLFGKMTEEIFSFIFSSDIIFVIVMILFGYIACYCIICAASSKAGLDEKQKVGMKADALIGITVLFSLCLVYGLFCSIQIMYLFNHGLFVLPAEFTFAEYARKGFFELLTVTIINIVLLLCINLYFKESKLLRVLLTFMTACTYIMIASAFYRMILYIDAYNLSFLRLFVLLFLIIDSIVLAGCIAFVFNKKFPLFGFSVVVVTICYILFSFSKPDYFIASYNTKNAKEITVNDIFYLTNISMDAAPIVVPFLDNILKDSSENNYIIVVESFYSKDILKSTVEDYYNRIETYYMNQGFRDYNISNYYAYKTIH